MGKNNLPLAFELPTRVGNVKLAVFVYDNLKQAGEKCASYPHTHNDYEILYCGEGGAILHVNGRAISFEKGTVLLIPPAAYHYQTLEDIREGFVRFSMRFSLRPPRETASSEEKKGYLTFKALLEDTVCLRDEEGTLLFPLEKMYEEINRHQDGYITYLKSLCGILFTEFIRLTQSDRAHLFPSEELRYECYWRNQIDHFLRTRYAEKVTLDDLAEALQVSRKQAARLVRRAFGVSYVEKLTATRIAIAKFEILYSKKKMEQIGNDCGFQSYSYFSACFHKQVGMTPSEFSKQNVGMIP